MFLNPLIYQGVSLFCMNSSNVTQLSKQLDFKYKSEIIFLFEPLLFRILAFTEVFCFVHIRCSVSKQRVRSFSVAEVHKIVYTFLDLSFSSIVYPIKLYLLEFIWIKERIFTTKRKWRQGEFSLPPFCLSIL